LKTVKIKPFHKAVPLILALLVPCALFAMQSSSYQIPSDTINVGGSASASGSYGLGDTLGEQATGDSASATYALRAGFWQMQDSYISMSSGGAAYWIVTTDNAAGYSFSVKASTAPALKSSNDSLADYVPATPSVPDFAFSVLAASSTFAFSPEGADITSKYLDNGSACNTGSSDTLNACWDGFTTVNATVSQAAASNQPFGATTTLNFEAGIGATRIQASGAYSATITVTAVTL
jgi:hypothetical protein